MLRIWGRTNSVNVKKALWAMEELGLEYERIDAGMQFGVVKTPEYLKMNPTGLVRVRFSMADDPNNSVTEAGIDSFSVEKVHPVTSAFPSASTAMPLPRSESLPPRYATQSRQQPQPSPVHTSIAGPAARTTTGSDVGLRLDKFLAAPGRLGSRGRAGQPATGLHGLDRTDPVHLVEGRVVHVARMDAAAQAAHQPGPGRLAEDRRADRVHADQSHPRPVPAQRAGQARAVPAGAHAAHQYVDRVDLGGDLVGEPGVAAGVVRVAVLVGPVHVRLGRADPRQPVEIASERCTLTVFEPLVADDSPLESPQGIADLADDLGLGHPGQHLSTEVDRALIEGEGLGLARPPGDPAVMAFLKARIDGNLAGGRMICEPAP